MVKDPGTIGRALVLTIALALIASGSAAEENEAGLAELVDVLHEKGLLDEGQYAQIRSKAEKQSDEEAWFERISIWGDFRARYEHFLRDSDRVAGDPDDRSRARYRLRVNLKARVNEYIDGYVQLASGENDSRSTNTSFGRSEPDFAPDEIWIQEAYIDLHPFTEGTIAGREGDLRVLIGRQPNPFLNKRHGRDVLLWDGDISPEGAAWRGSLRLGEALDAYANAGYFVIDENSGSKDPGLMGAQLGANYQLSEKIVLGARGSIYHFRNLDRDFFERGVDDSKPPTDAGGNLGDSADFGLSASDTLDVLETGVYLTYTGIENWPVTFFADASKNTDAQELYEGPQDMAWLLGLSVGDKKHFAELGVIYAYVEADAFPAQFIDSDLLDGYTNRKGFGFYAARQIFSNTDLNFAVMWSEAIEDQYFDADGGDPGDAGVFDASVENSDRIRLQADLVVKF